MTNELIQRLRDRAYAGKVPDALCEEAANEIERLRDQRNYWLRQSMAFSEHADNMRLALLEPARAILCEK